MKTFTLLLLVFSTVSLWGYQEKAEFNNIQGEVGQKIRVEPRRGWLLYLEPRNPK